MLFSIKQRPRDLTLKVMEQVFPGKKPRGLTHEQKPHIEPEKEFDTQTYNVNSKIYKNFQNIAK